MRSESLTDGKVILRPLEAQDAESWLAGEDQEQLRWFEAPRPAVLSDVAHFISECQVSWRNLGAHRHWGIRDAASEELVGGVDLRDVGTGEVNVSYVVFPQFRRKGYAWRAALLALDYAARTMGARTAAIKMLRDNVASRELAEKLGAVLVGEEPSNAGSTFSILKLELRAPG